MPVEFVHDAKDPKDAYKLLMAYDGSGRRISKTRYSKNVQYGYWTRNVVTHYTGIGTEVRESYFGGALENAKVVVNMPQGLGRYTPEDAVDGFNGVGANQLAGYRPPAKFEWYLKNHLGSTMLVYGTSAYSDPLNSGYKSGVKAAYDYRAFGEQVDLTEPTDKVTENFTGKEKDGETELNYFGARYLDPMLGMWTSVDPKRQFSSPYLYVGNGYNPVNGVDPNGNEFDDKFKSPRASRDDFKKIYNTKSIKENVEYATLFYETKRIGKDGTITSTFSYTKPNRGTVDHVDLDAKLPENVYDENHPGRIIEASYPLENGDAHTHSRGDEGYDWENPSEDDMNGLVTEKGVLFRPDGKVLEYDRSGNSYEIDK